MNDQSDKPGYGYQLAQGATSLTEAWNARRSSSQNHFMLGQIVEWFYHDLAGIQADPGKPGFQKIIIKPTPVGDITFATASYNSVRGRIVSAWRRNGSQFTLNVTVPPNTTATVFVPAQETVSVAEGNIAATKVPGATFLRFAGRRAVYHIGSGRYVFHTALGPPVVSRLSPSIRYDNGALAKTILKDAKNEDRRP